MHHSGYFGPRSFHPDGAHVLLGDGSVRLLTEDIDVTLHRNLHSRNGGEVDRWVLIATGLPVRSVRPS